MAIYLDVDIKKIELLSLQTQD